MSAATGADVGDWRCREVQGGAGRCREMQMIPRDESHRRVVRMAALASDAPGNVEGGVGCAGRGRL